MTAFFPVLMAPCAMAGDTGQEVELRCKIVPLQTGRRLDYWRVALEKSTGEPLGMTTALTGDTVHFRHLRPDIYIVCLDGSEERHRCQSVDIIPPADHKDHSFLRKLVPPMFKPSHSPHRVSASGLEVPVEARDELLHAEVAQMRGDDQEMLEHLGNALKICPDFADALNNLGVYYRRVKNYALALEYFSQVTRLQPDYYGGWLNLGSTLLCLGQFQQSLDPSLKALALRRDDALVNSQVALGYYYLRQYDEARKYFERVAELDPCFANSPQLFLAHIALAERRDGDAEEYYRQFLKLHPNSPKAPYYKRLLNGLVAGTIVHSPLDKGTEDR